MRSIALNVIFLFPKDFIKVVNHKRLDISFANPRIFRFCNTAIHYIARQVNTKQFLTFIFELFHLACSGDFVICNFFNLFFTFLLRERRIKNCLIDLLCHIAQNACALTNGVFKNTNTLQATVIDFRINGSFGYNITDDNGITLLTTSINTTNTLLNRHRVPREVIVNHKIAELIIQTFATNLGKQ